MPAFYSARPFHGPNSSIRGLQLCPSLPTIGCLKILRRLLSVVGSWRSLSHNRFMVRRSALRAIELVGEVDDRQRLHADVPESVRPGQVRLIVLLPDAEEDTAGDIWARAVAREWLEELQDSQQDLYTLEDGQPVDAAR